MRTVVVEPFGDLWAVRLDDVEPQVFASGRAAEDAARKIAETLAAAGDYVELTLFLRDGLKAARFLCLPPIADEAPLLVGGSLLSRPERSAVVHA